MDDNKIKINIYLNGHHSSLTVNREDEGDVRAAAKKVNEYIIKAKKYFDSPQLGEDRLLAMVAYQFALSGIRAEKKANSQQFINKIEEWDKLLEQQLLSDYTEDIAFVSKRKKEEE